MKIVVGGDKGVGKTTLVRKNFGRGFNSQYMMTIGADFALKEAVIDGRAIKFQIWDLAGQTRFGAARSVYYLGCLGALLLFDVTQRESFENLENWIKEIWNHNGKGVIPLIIMGNKIDLRDQHPDSITDEMAQRYCAKLTEQTKANGFEVRYMQSCAITGLNALESLEMLGRVYFEYLDKNKKPEYGRRTPIVSEQIEEKAEVVEQIDYSHFLKIKPVKDLLKEYINNPVSLDSIYNIRSKLEDFSVELVNNASKIAEKNKRKTMKLEDILESLKQSKITQDTQLQKYRFSSVPIYQMLKLFNNRISKEVTNPLRGLLEIITLAISKKLFQEIKNETKKIIDDDIDKVWDDFIKNPGSYIESIPISVPVKKKKLEISEELQAKIDKIFSIEKLNNLINNFEWKKDNTKLILNFER